MDKNLKTFSEAIKFSSGKEESWKMAENYESSSSKKKYFHNIPLVKLMLDD